MPTYDEVVAAHRWTAAAPLQHRCRRVRSPPAREDGDDPRGPARRGHGRSGGASWNRIARCRWPTGSRRAACSRAIGSPSCSRRRPMRRRRSSPSIAAGRSSCRCRCSTAMRASATGSRTPTAKVLVTDAAHRARFEALRARASCSYGSQGIESGGDDGSPPSTRAPTTRRSCTTRRARRGWPRAAPWMPTGTCSRDEEFTLLPRGPRTARASTAWGSGRGLLGSAAARAVAARARCSAWLPARGRLRAPGASSTSSAATR